MRIPQASGITIQTKSAPVFTDSLSAIRQHLQNSSVPEFLVHLPTLLVEYYFNYICVISSSFDGMLNPFRSTVSYRTAQRPSTMLFRVWLLHTFHIISHVCLV